MSRDPYSTAFVVHREASRAEPPPSPDLRAISHYRDGVEDERARILEAAQRVLRPGEYAVLVEAVEERP